MPKSSAMAHIGRPIYGWNQLHVARPARSKTLALFITTNINHPDRQEAVTTQLKANGIPFSLVPTPFGGDTGPILDTAIRIDVPYGNTDQEAKLVQLMHSIGQPESNEMVRDFSNEHTILWAQRALATLMSASQTNSPGSKK